MTDPLSLANYDNTKEILRDTPEQPMNDVSDIRRGIVAQALVNLESAIPLGVAQPTPRAFANSTHETNQSYWQEAA